MAIDILDIVLIILPIAIIALGGSYIAVKKFVVDLVTALEDDNISKEELELLIQDAIGIINVIKDVFNRIKDFILRK